MNQPLTPSERKKLEDFKAVVEQKKVLLSARDDILSFAHAMLPHRDYPKDPRYSKYEPAAHHKIIADALMRVESGHEQRLVITMPPRHGKSELITRLFPPFFVGRDPTREVILAGYNQTFAEKSFGKKIQAMMESDRYKAIFPDATFDGGSRAVDMMMLSEGGQIACAGRGGTMTGLGAHLLVIDDPVKNKAEAESEVMRDDCWDWFTTTAYSRLYGGGACVIVMTRWNEDDIVGRLTNPNHPKYDPDIGAGWTVLHFPAIFTKEYEDLGKVLGKKVGDTLWPEHNFDIKYFDQRRKLDPASFQALYQGNPSPLDGDLFKAEWLAEYTDDEMPPLDKLSIYGASDHGVTLKRRSDPSVIGCVGVDDDYNIWVLPDLVWRRLETDKIVDEMLAKMKTYRPFVWWMENENIAKAFGPFLMKRMMEEQVFTLLEGRTPSKDKVTRSQAVRGIMARRKVKFPKNAWWWQAARRQMLTFPNGTAFDFVDFISWIGIGIQDIVPGEDMRARQTPPEEIPGTLAWLKAETAAKEANDARRARARSGY